MRVPLVWSSEWTGNTEGQIAPRLSHRHWRRFADFGRPYEWILGQKHLSGNPTYREFVPLRGQLESWNGVTTEAGSGYSNIGVWYELDGGVLTVRKAGKPDIFYVLS
jgi:hypothetical protein